MNALLIVDIQNDFMPGGPLPVAEADKIVPIVNELQSKFELIVAAQDWHPAHHGSFAANYPGKKPGDRIMLNSLEQILWPVHCVQNTPGAAFVDGLDTSRFARVFHKGTDPRIDSYGAFFDNGHQKETRLEQFLKERKVTDVYIVGVATDYCVKFTALDGAQLGFKTHVFQNACRGVNASPTDVKEAFAEMRRAGVILLD